MGAVVAVILCGLTAAVVVVCFVQLGLIRQVDDLDRRLTLVGMAMPGKAGRIGLRPGSLAPEIIGRTLEGDRFASSDWLGSEHLVLFAHPGCPPCESLVPDLIESVRAGALPPTVVVSEGPSEGHPEAWREPNVTGGSLAVVAQDHSAIARRFETFVTPHLFVVGPGGQIMAQGLANSVDEVRTLLKRARRSNGVKLRADTNDRE
jgi:thiol-disulfide isomerase/thioredoxin